MPEDVVHAQGPATDNPAQAKDAGEQRTGSLLDGLAKDTAGSGGQTASQQTAPGETSGSQEGAGATVQLPGFATALPKESRSDPKIASYVSKFKSWDELVKSAIELEAKLGQAGGAEVPATPDKYDLGEIDKDLVDQADRWRKTAHELGLTPDQARKGWEQLKAGIAGLMESAAKREQESYQETETKLKTEWGNSYEANRKLMARGFALLDKALVDELQAAGLGNSYNLARFLHRLGLLFGEDRQPQVGPVAPKVVPGIDRPGL